ncbi:MAG: exodeoxyribonuclease [Acidobacteriota bacterium]|jgi:exodeoxyribonuclease-3|nr:exodeoxyribonuclease [Acidobacteriota bacterium]
MKIATWNVNSVIARLPLVTRWLESAKPDVLCLQELKCIDEKFPLDQFRDLGYHAEVFGQRTYNGVAILSRTPPTDVQRGFPNDEEGAHSRLIAATVDGVRVVNVYIPNGQFVGSDKYRFKLEWIQRLQRYFDIHKTDEPVLLCGDFNVAPEERDVHDPVLWEGRILCSMREREALEQLKGWGFRDAFRLHTEDAGHFSWWDYRMGSFRRDAGLRIDHIWVSDPLARTCKESWIDKEPRTWERPSDHTPVIGVFDN